MLCIFNKFVRSNDLLLNTL